jgi:hypothetical protein
MDLKEIVWEGVGGLMWLRAGFRSISCENGSEFSAFVKFGDFFFFE